MKLTDCYRQLAAAIIRQAVSDLEDVKYQTDAYRSLNTEWGRSLLRFSGHGLSLQKFDAEVSSIIRTANLRLYSVAMYARGHTLKETATRYDVSEEDMRNYAQRKRIHFMEV